MSQLDLSLTTRGYTKLLRYSAASPILSGSQQFTILYFDVTSKPPWQGFPMCLRDDTLTYP